MGRMSSPDSVGGGSGNAIYTYLIAGRAIPKAWEPEHTRFGGIAGLGWLECSVCGRDMR